MHLDVRTPYKAALPKAWHLAHAVELPLAIGWVTYQFCPLIHGHYVNAYTYVMIRVALKEVLRHKRISQRELARRTGRHPDVISKFAREATGGVSYELLDHICNALGCDPGLLLRFEQVADQSPQLPLFNDQPLGTATELKGAPRLSTHGTELLVSENLDRNSGEQSSHTRTTE